MATLAATIPVKSAAPGQYLGYGLQDVRLCRHLLTSSAGCRVSLEWVDDTAIHRPDGQMLLEQSKSALSGNPVSDSSVEMWKCFANWAELCVHHGVDPSTTQFRLYVCPKKEGPLAQLLHGADTEADAKILLAKIAKKVTPSTKDKGCNPKISEFLTTGDTLCSQIICNFQLIRADDPLDQIREALRLSVTEDALDDFCAHAIGMAKNKIAALIRAGEKPIIEADSFRAEVRAFIRKRGSLGILASTTQKPSGMDIESLLAAAPTFVQQLLKVDMPKAQIVRAVGDYLRSDADRTLWAAEGHIVKESLEELHETLEAHFEITRDEIEELMIEKGAETRGRQLYRRCVGHQAPLEGRDVPGYFIPGTFNMLADAVRLGWHPDYADFFPGE